LVPSVKFQPALGREAILSQRTGLDRLMVGLSVALVIGAVTVGHRIAGRLGTGNGPSHIDSGLGISHRG
jgi:hypothetical protein